MFDGDIVSSTDNPTMIKGVYKNEYPVVGVVEKGEKKDINKEELVKSDMFGFGSRIGTLTNRSTTMYTMLSQYDEDSIEYKTLMNRIRMTVKLQSLQIDSAKIGRKVKFIPKTWTRWNKINDEDDEELIQQKMLFNKILCDKVPYFFIYLYDSTKKDYKKYLGGYANGCKCKFGMTIEDLTKLPNKTQEQIEFLDKFQRFTPVIDNDSVMNMVCHYIESVNKEINFAKFNASDDCMDLMYNKDIEFSKTRYTKVNDTVEQFIEDLKMLRRTMKQSADNGVSIDIDSLYKGFEDKLCDITSNWFEITNYMVDIFYNKHRSYSRNILWKICGKYIFENVCQHSDCDNIYVPIQDENGDIVYLNKHYGLQKVSLNDFDTVEKEDLESGFDIE